jgi:hypothetical protein
LGGGPTPFRAPLQINGRLRVKLDEVREETDHAGTIGVKSKAAVRETLRGFLPSGSASATVLSTRAFGDGAKQTAADRRPAL